MASARRVFVWTAACAVILGGGGCATPGPNHVYTLRATEPSIVRDLGPEGSVEVPSFTKEEDGVTGLAYDPYTDHLFLRLAPGNRIRVVDRPDSSIKREFTLAELPATGGGDLTVRPRDGHLFFACRNEAFVVESDRYGKFVRRLELQNLDGDVTGIAYDAVQNRLLVATGGSTVALKTYDLKGNLQHSSELPLEQVTSLAYDATHRELHALVLGATAITVLNGDGKILRQEPMNAPADFVDLGQRSFVRVF